MSPDLDGVGCMVCHRATDAVATDPEAPHLGNAQIYYLDGADSEVRLGPYAYETGMTAFHPARQSAFHAQGAFCGQCHDIHNPLLEGHRTDGTATGRPFAIERTYSEWAASELGREGGQTCQDCHMPRIEGEGYAALGGEPRAGVRRHDLAGSSAWQLRAMASIYEVDAEVRDAWMRTAGIAEGMLQRAARLEITGASAADGELSVTVRVHNETGHRLPTGYPEGRRMWLQVEVLDDAGAVLAGSGLYDEAAMRLVEDEQARTYEVKLAQGATPSFHFALNDTVLEDTRIPPRGYQPTEERDIVPVGRDYSDGAGGYRSYDEATFRFAVCEPGALRVRARLRFQSTTREYIEFLRDNAPDDPDPAIDNWGALAYSAWEAHGGGAPFDMAEATSDLTGGCDPGADAGPGDDAGPTPDRDAGAAGDAALDRDSSPGPVADAGLNVDAGVGGSDDGGCGCAVLGSRSPAEHRGLAVLAALGATAPVLRRRRRRSAGDAR